jgi:hypothetical protein
VSGFSELGGQGGATLLSACDLRIACANATFTVYLLCVEASRLTSGCTAHIRPARRYDVADVASHVYRQLAADGYQGLTIHNIYRDEVQARLPCSCSAAQRGSCSPLRSKTI